MFQTRTIGVQVILPNKKICNSKTQVRVMLFLAIDKKNSGRKSIFIRESQAKRAKTHPGFCSHFNIYGLKKEPFVDHRSVDTTSAKDGRNGVPGEVSIRIRRILPFYIQADCQYGYE
jgi:hypothetical protein